MEHRESQNAKGQNSAPKTPAVSVLKDLAILVGVIVVAAIILSVLHIGCPIKFTTGLSCPGCGMFRAWTAFLTLHPLEALVYHPLFWAVPIALVAAVLLQEGVLGAKARRACSIIMAVLLVLLIALWAVRLFTFPDSTLLFGPLENASYPADIVGWSTPAWMEWLQGLF